MAHRCDMVCLKGVLFNEFLSVSKCPMKWALQVEKKRTNIEHRAVAKQERKLSLNDHIKVRTLGQWFICCLLSIKSSIDYKKAKLRTAAKIWMVRHLPNLHFSCFPSSGHSSQLRMLLAMTATQLKTTDT